MMEIFFAVIAAVLGFLFSSYLIDAIRSADEKTAAQYKTKACAAFSAIVLIMLLIIKS